MLAWTFLLIEFRTFPAMPCAPSRADCRTPWATAPSASPTRQVKAGVHGGHERLQKVVGEHLEHAGLDLPGRGGARLAH